MPSRGLGDVYKRQEQQDERSRREPDTGVGGGMDRGEGVKPQEPSLNVIVERESESIVCVGGLDTDGANTTTEGCRADTWTIVQA